ncbi:site-specific recombinase like [hydrothermal vent metagenome]|uniref:Site-specific recombinase like n=1 Tax=hydrothermal vent metagenome TaxID=652676 RepID=A0A1W1B8G0_9ZZZZ
MFVESDEDLEKVLKENEKLLEDFAAYLQAKNLKKRTIEKHYFNVDLFLNYFLPYNGCFSENEVANVYEGVSEFDTYFGNWYIRKYLQSSVNNLKESITSIKKFYQFLYEEGKLSKLDFEILKNEIKTSKDEWIEIMKRYEDGDDLEEIYDALF